MDTICPNQFNSTVMQNLWLIINRIEVVHKYLGKYPLKRWLTNCIWVLCAISAIYSAIYGKGRVVNNYYEYVFYIHNCDSTISEPNPIEMAGTFVRD